MYRVIYAVFVGLVCLGSLVEVSSGARRQNRRRNQNRGEDGGRRGGGGGGGGGNNNSGSDTRVKPRPQIPLQAETQLPHSRALPGCTFGEEFYDLESEWHPNLGDPFGEMACVLCECRPVVEDGILIGKTFCLNIRCPDITCKDGEEPSIRPGECCKTCPSQVETEKETDGAASTVKPNSYPDDTASTEGTEDVAQGEAFVSLMSGRLVSVDTHAIARGSFALLNDNLHFTIYYTRLSAPTEVVFTGVLNTTLHVHTVGDASSNMVCGEWKNVPQIVSRDLRNRNLFVSLITRSHERGEVRGRIIPHRALAAESFSVLLTPKRRNGPVNPHLGKGGVVMMSATKNGNTMNFAALFDGLVESPERAEEITVVVEIVKRNDVLKRVETVVGREDLDIVDAINRLPGTIKKLLTRGQLSLRITVLGSEQTGMLTGDITPLRTCNIIHAVLSGSQALVRPRTTGASGSAVFTIEDDGTINYQVRLTGVQTEVVSLTIEMESKNPNKRRIVADIFRNYRDGQAEGRWSRPKSRDVQLFLHGDLYVNVATEAFMTSELRGRIVQLPYQSHIPRVADMPVQLSGAMMDPPQETGAAGHAWLVLDQSCSLHYEIAVVGLNSAQDDSIGTDSPPSSTHYYAEIGEIDSEGTNNVRLVLNAFRGNSARGTLNDVDAGLLESMDGGLAFIQVSTKNHRDGEIRGLVVLPNTCHRSPDSNNIVPVHTPQVGHSVEADPNSCFFEGRYRAASSSWSPDFDNTCTTCTCKKTVVICDPVVCPVLTCENPVTFPGECCATCPKLESETESSDDSQDVEGCFYNGDKKVHRVGTQWHPYIPPFGYSRCVLCTCMPGGVFNCSRLACPELNCPKPIRLNPDDCCQVCPEPEPTTPLPVDDTLLQADEVEKGCSFLGDFYRNGEEWHPLVAPFGTMSCVRCRCRNGQAKCKGRTCPQLNCKELISVKGECCPQCKEDTLSYLSTSSSEVSSDLRDRRKPKRS